MYNNTSLLLCCNIIIVVQLFLELILISYRIICSNNLLMCNKYYNNYYQYVYIYYLPMHMHVEVHVCVYENFNKIIAHSTRLFKIFPNYLHNFNNNLRKY